MIIIHFLITLEKKSIIFLPLHRKSDVPRKSLFLINFCDTHFSAWSASVALV